MDTVYQLINYIDERDYGLFTSLGATLRMTSKICGKSIMPYPHKNKILLVQYNYHRTGFAVEKRKVIG